MTALERTAYGLARPADAVAGEIAPWKVPVLVLGAAHAAVALADEMRTVFGPILTAASEAALRDAME